MNQIIMKIEYDYKQNIAYINIHNGEYYTTIKLTDNILLDIDTNKNIKGIEILDTTQTNLEQLIRTI